MEFRPEGLAFFWPLITLFARCISSDMLLANIMIINPKYSPANVKVISLRLLSGKSPGFTDENIKRSGFSISPLSG
jgi:hypothetical protein